MNATAIASKSTNPRLHRIQKVSRLLKTCVLIYVVVPLGLAACNFKSLHLANGMISLFNHPYASVSDIPPVMLVLSALGTAVLVLSALGTAVYVFGVISFYRLLGLFEKGVIFSAAHVVQMQRLGGCLMVYGLLAFLADLVYIGGFVLPWMLLDAVTSPWIVVGYAIYLVAWIMDEGRKMQEEQELTV